MLPIQFILVILGWKRNFKFIFMKIAWEKTTLEVDLYKDSLGKKAHLEADLSLEEIEKKCP